MEAEASTQSPNRWLGSLRIPMRLGLVLRLHYLADERRKLTNLGDSLGIGKPKVCRPNGHHVRAQGHCDDDPNPVFSHSRSSHNTLHNIKYPARTRSGLFDLWHAPTDFISETNDRSMHNDIPFKRIPKYASHYYGILTDKNSFFHITPLPSHAQVPSGNFFP